MKEIENMLNINGAMSMMVEHIFDNSTIGLYDIEMPDVTARNGQIIISDAEGNGVTVPDTVIWNDYSNDVEEVWETDLGNGNKVRLSWYR